MKNKLFGLVGILSFGLALGSNYPSKIDDEKATYTVPGTATFDIDSSPIRTEFERQSLVEILRNTGANENEIDSIVDKSNVKYGAPNDGTADLKFSTIKFGDRDDPDQSPGRYGKSLDVIGPTALYIINKPYNQVTLKDITDVEARDPQLYTIPLDLKEKNKKSLAEYNLIWLQAQGKIKGQEPNYLLLENARNAESPLNYISDDQTIAVVTGTGENRKYSKMQIVGEKDLSDKEDDRNYFRGWFTTIRKENLSDK